MSDFLFSAPINERAFNRVVKLPVKFRGKVPDHRDYEHVSKKVGRFLSFLKETGLQAMWKGFQGSLKLRELSFCLGH